MLTIKEAIRLLSECSIDYSYDDKLQEAFDMAIETLEEKLEAETPSFPCIEGELAEMYVDDRWVKGKIVKGYRFGDGIVTIEDEDGNRYWCGEDRTDIYREGNDNES